MLSEYKKTVVNLNNIANLDLVRVVYISRLTIKSRLCTTALKNIENQAEIYNKPNGITGILCYGNGRFLQCLEGKKEVVIPLLARIFNDVQHYDIQVLLSKPIHDYTFRDWRMRSVFFERWMWSQSTKNIANMLSGYLPFKPQNWSISKTEQFLSDIQQFERPPYTVKSAISFHAIGKLIVKVAAPHQAFIVVQSMLAILTLSTLLIIIWHTP